MGHITALGDMFLYNSTYTDQKYSLVDQICGEICPQQMQ